MKRWTIGMLWSLYIYTEVNIRFIVKHVSARWHVHNIKRSNTIISNYAFLCPTKITIQTKIEHRETELRLFTPIIQSMIALQIGRSFKHPYSR